MESVCFVGEVVWKDDGCIGLRWDGGTLISEELALSSCLRNHSSDSNNFTTSLMYLSYSRPKFWKGVGGRWW